MSVSAGSSRPAASSTDPTSAAVVALKRLGAAKTRFRNVPATLRAELAWSMALDTLLALRSAVDRVVLVTDEPTAARGLSEAGLDVAVANEPTDDVEGGPLNRALASGLAIIAGVDVGLAVLADLPALRADSVRRVVADAARSASPVLVPDADNVGTTMLAGPPQLLVPRFGGASASRHRGAGARDVADLATLPDARADVDDQQALRAAAARGLGRWTRDLLARHPELLAARA